MNTENFIPVNSFIENADIDGEKVLRVIKDPSVKAVDEATYAKLANCEFHNGTVEVQVLSRLLPNAPGHARGFIGVAFRAEENDTSFESMYIRPTNGRCEDQVRRNHSTQYFSYPDYKFDRLRKESPEVYESYADMELNEWIKIRIEVDGERAKLFLNDLPQPVLIVTDLKHGADNFGGIGLWAGVGTEAFFKDLKVTSR